MADAAKVAEYLFINIIQYQTIAYEIQFNAERG